MNPLTLLLRLPFLPIEGVIRLGYVIGDEAERQVRDPAQIRGELEEAQRRRDAGEISDEDLVRIEDQLTATMVEVPTPASEASPSNDRS